MALPSAVIMTTRVSSTVEQCCSHSALKLFTSLGETSIVFLSSETASAVPAPPAVAAPTVSLSAGFCSD
eukprot:3323335-Pyramimonas_sp.AAC.1